MMLSSVKCCFLHEFVYQLKKEHLKLFPETTHYAVEWGPLPQYCSRSTFTPAEYNLWSTRRGALVSGHILWCC
jgi:hypothetical protein